MKLTKLKQEFKQNVFHVLIGKNATFCASITFILQIISLVTLYVEGTKNWNEDYYPPYISELASKIEIAPYFISLIFLANIGGFIIVKYRYYQMAYFELSDKINTFTLIIGQISLVTNIALFLFPYHQKTRYHYFFTWIFFICANIYCIMNVYFFGKLRNELKHFVHVGTNFDISRMSSSIRRSTRHNIIQLDDNHYTLSHDESFDLIPMIGFKYLSECGGNASMEQPYSFAVIDNDYYSMLEKLSIVTTNKISCTSTVKDYNYDNFENLYHSSNQNQIAKLLLYRCNILLIIRAILIWIIITISFAQLATSVVPFYIKNRNKELKQTHIDTINFYYSISGVFEWIHCLAFTLNIGLFSFEFKMKLPKKHFKKDSVTFLIEKPIIKKFFNHIKHIIIGNSGTFHALNAAILRLLSLFIILALKKSYKTNHNLFYSISEVAADIDTSCWYITCIYFSLLSSISFMDYNMKLINNYDITKWDDVVIFLFGIFSVITSMAMYLFSATAHPYMNTFISFIFYSLTPCYFWGDFWLKHKIHNNIPSKNIFNIVHVIVSLMLSLSGFIFIIFYSILKGCTIINQKNSFNTCHLVLHIAKHIVISSEWIFASFLIVGLINFSLYFYEFNHLKSSSSL